MTTTTKGEEARTRRTSFSSKALIITMGVLKGSSAAVIIVLLLSFASLPGAKAGEDGPRRPDNTSRPGYNGTPKKPEPDNKEGSSQEPASEGVPVLAGGSGQERALGVKQPGGDVDVAGESLEKDAGQTGGVPGQPGGVPGQGDMEERKEELKQVEPDVQQDHEAETEPMAIESTAEGGEELEDEKEVPGAVQAAAAQGRLNDARQAAAAAAAQRRLNDALNDARQAAAAQGRLNDARQAAAAQGRLNEALADVETAAEDVEERGDTTDVNKTSKTLEEASAQINSQDVQKPGMLSRAWNTLKSPLSSFRSFRGTG